MAAATLSTTVAAKEATASMVLWYLTAKLGLIGVSSGTDHMQPFVISSKTTADPIPAIG